MEIKLAATMRVAPRPVNGVLHPSSSLPAPISDDQIFVKLNMPLRQSPPVIDFLSMTAMERTLWEIRARSEMALNAQTKSLSSADVIALIAG